MWKILAVTAVLAISVASQPNNTSNSKNQPPNEGDLKSFYADPSSHYSYSQEAPANSNQKPFKWDAAIKRPEWWAVFIALATFGLIFWQAWETRKAAEISARALVSTFRPKIEICGMVLNPRNHVTFLAIKEPAWKVEMILVNRGASKATIEKCDLTVSISKDDPLPPQRKVFDIASTEWKKFTIPAGERFPLEFKITNNLFWTGIGTQVEMLKVASNSGQAVWPTCQGTIIYIDENGHRRQTGFSRRWNISGECFEVSDPELEYQD